MSTKKDKPSTPAVGEVDMIEDFDLLQEEMNSYCNGVQIEGNLPTDLSDPDPFPKGDEESTTKDDLHSVVKVIGG